MARAIAAGPSSVADADAIVGIDAQKTIVLRGGTL
jgi:hypothetical protein